MQENRASIDEVDMNTLDLKKKKLLRQKKIPDNRENKFLKAKDIEYFLNKLLMEKENILNKTKNHLQDEKFCLDRNELSDPLDEASIHSQTSQELRFRNRDVLYLKKVNLGLDRLFEGTYGLCDECNEEISIERLKARPTAELCISCKEDAELGEKNSILGKTSKSMGKSLSEMSQK